MTPDERQLLSGLFDRMNGAANQPRDRDAETFINDRVRAQAYAPYLLSQTVIVQEQALRAAADRIQQLEAQVQQGGAAQPQEPTSFLGSIGKSIFGAAPAQQRQAPQGYGNQPMPQDPGAYRGQGQGGPWGQQPPQQGYAPQQQGYAPQQQAAPQGGGFLKGALGAAAGVAGGVLAADALSNLFGGHNNPFGIASGGFGGGNAGAGGETVVNNYYDNASPADTTAADNAQQDFLQDQADDFGSNDSGNNDGSYDV